MRETVGPGFLCAWLAAFASAQQPELEAAPNPIDLAAVLQPLRDQHHVPALGAAVIVDGRLTALGVSGVRHRGDPTPVAADDRWHLGSCTKAMTATLLARQVEAGRLQWTTTVAEALPDLAPGMHDEARGITLAQLLQHRAGLPANPPPALWRELFHAERSDTEARTDTARQLLAVAPEPLPGTGFRYSNAGYMVAGLIAERVGEAPWQELMQRDVFTPLGIERAGFGPPGDADTVAQPFGHRPGEQGAAVWFDNPSALGPAGTVHMPLADWARFVACQLGDGAPLLREPATLRALHSAPAGGDHALGFVVTERAWANGPVLTHSGSNTLWFCVCWLAPQDDFAVLVTCNQGETAAACDAVAALLVERFAPRPK